MKLSSTEVVLWMLDQAFDHKSWHGTNLRGAIRGLTVVEAAWRPHPRRHNIWEIILHAAYWKYTVRRRLLGEKRGSFSIKGSDWFQRPALGADDQEHWEADVALLVSTHRALREAIARLKPEDLGRPADNGKVSVLTLLTGIAAHDLYHAGQIQLLKRLRQIDAR
jgi:uncharacterized damage-inducible protein DinB